MLNILTESGASGIISLKRIRSTPRLAKLRWPRFSSQRSSSPTLLNKVFVFRAQGVRGMVNLYGQTDLS